MFTLQVGQPRIGKTKNIKEKINEIPNKLLIFDFNEDYSDIDGHVIDLDEYNPLLGALSLGEVKIFNAAYLPGTRCLYKKAEDIYREMKMDRIQQIIYYTVERLNASWEKYEVDYALELSEKISFKTTPKQKHIDGIVDAILENQKVILKSKSVSSTHLRVMMYLLLYKIHNLNLDITIVADEVSTLFFKGNMKLLIEVIDFSKLDFVISCNRPSNIPKEIGNIVDEWLLYKNTDKTEVKYLTKHFNIGEDIDFESIPIGKYASVLT